MAQFLRVCKPEVCCVARSYGRYQQNHYEILNVSSDASQKEIRQAFLRLSKQLHPDTSGKQSHADFVRLNEAYSILGKESTRRQYDFNLKYCRYNSAYVHHSHNTQRYGSRWEYEVRTAGGPWPPPQQKPNTYFSLLVTLFLWGLGLLQTIFIFYSCLNVRKKIMLRNARIESEYQQIRDSARVKASQFALKNLESLEDLNEYLTKDSE